MTKYSREVLDHFQAPRNVGVIEDADAVATVSNPACGDTTKLHLKIEDGVIVDAKWQTRGCGSSIAASSAVSELVRGLSLEEAQGVDRRRVDRALGGLPAAKGHSAALAVDALRQTLANYEARHP